jgi:hypothetical protein
VYSSSIFCGWVAARRGGFGFLALREGGNAHESDGQQRGREPKRHIGNE